MRFVLIDLVPALLTWEGRDFYAPAEAQSGALDLVYDLFSDFRLAAVTDGDRPASTVREALEKLELAAYFESVGTSSVFGPVVTPRVIRRITAAIGGTGRTIIVTARPGLTEALHHSGIPSVTVEGDLAAVSGAVRRMAFGRVSP